MNIIIYNTGILNGETFNMFYISPYFISTLPVFDIIQQNVPYITYLLIYILAIATGGLIILGISMLIKRVTTTIGKKVDNKINYSKDKIIIKNN